MVGRDSVVGMASRCRLDGRSGYRIAAGARFSAPVQTDHGVRQMGTGSFLGIKRPERGVNSQAYLALRLKRD